MGLAHRPLALQLNRGVDEVADLLWGEIGEPEKVLALEMVHHVEAPLNLVTERAATTVAAARLCFALTRSKLHGPHRVVGDGHKGAA